jgi:glycosyltransferase involved in cell wall biosynthesis
VRLPRRVLLLITDLEIGGTPTVVRELATRLHRPPDVLVEVACLSRWGPVADQIRAAGVPVAALDATGPRDLRVVGRLARLIRRGRFDTVFSFLVHANAVAAAASPFAGNVRFLQSIQTTQPEPLWHWRLQRLIQPVADRVVGPSPSVAQVARERAGVQEDRFVVIPNAVDPDAFDRGPDPPPGGPYRVGFIGRLDPIKRVPLLLDAFAEGARKDFRLEIYGEGVERQTIERKARELGIADRVTLHGAVASPRSALAGLHALALPSEAEGFGLVLIEAMAAGVPVVAADAPGIRDVVRDGQTGLLVNPTMRRTFWTQLLSVILVEKVRGPLIANGLREVRERYSWEVVLPQYRRLLQIK